jgi:hypothetical protein
MMDQVMVMMVTEVIQMIHCVVSSGGGWVIPIVWMVLWMIEQVMIVMTGDEH